MLEAYRIVKRFRVPFGDVDMLRHVNNIAYLRWAEQLRSDYLLDVIGASSAWTTGMILARMNIDYERQIAYRENVAIGCRVSRFGTKSMDFSHEVWSDDSGERCARITATVVAMDYQAQATIVLPDLWRARIVEFEPEIIPGPLAAGRGVDGAKRSP
jgi:acyl-CoA thioester hydrolase